MVGDRECWWGRNEFREVGMEWMMGERGDVEGFGLRVGRFCEGDW